MADPITAIPRLGSFSSAIDPDSGPIHDENARTSRTRAIAKTAIRSTMCAGLSLVPCAAVTSPDSAMMRMREQLRQVERIIVRRADPVDR